MPAQQNKEAKQEKNQTNEAVQSSKNEPEKVLFSWKAPSRPFKKRSREFWIKTMAIAGISAFILFLIEGAMPVILIISLLFLFYVLTTVEPETVEYSLTNKGVKFADKRTDWQLLTRFWFIRRFDSNLLVFEMAVLPGRLELVVNKDDTEKIKNSLKNYLPEEEAPPTGLDKAAKWMSRRMPQ